MSTPASTATPYCTPAQFLTYADWRVVADLVSDDDTQHTLASLTNDPNLAAVLMPASGREEASCFRGQRYVIDPVSGQNDLAALTGASKALLQKLVADLTFGFLLERRPQPNQEPPISYTLAIQALEDLANGELILGITESMSAGHQSHHVQSPADAYGQALISSDARRYFGRRGAYRSQRNQ